MLARERVPLVRRDVQDAVEVQEPSGDRPPSSSDPGAGLIGAMAASYTIAAAGAVVMATFGGLALAEADAIRAGCGANRSCAPADLADGHAFAIASDIALGAFVAGAAVGTVLLIVHLQGGPEAEAQAVLAPWLAPKGAGLFDAVEVSAGIVHTCARRATGAVVRWGRDDSGQLGNGPPRANSTRVPVRGLADASSIAAGYFHTCALVRSGLRCWGRNESGQLGDDTIANRDEPVDVIGSP